MENEEKLLLAAENGEIAKAKKLISSGVDVNAKNDDGWTALHWASRNGHTEIVKLLIKAWASVNTKNNYGLTALMLASMYGHTEVAKFLINSVADVNIKNNNDKTAFMLAEEKGYSEIVNLLESADSDRTDVEQSTKKTTKRKYNKANQTLSFKDKVLGVLSGLLIIVLMASFLFMIILPVYNYINEPSQYNAEHYENLGAHTFELRGVESYTSGTKSKKTRYRIHYRTSIDREIFHYRKGGYKTRAAAEKGAEANPTPTKYVYRINNVYILGIRGERTEHFSDFATAEEVAAARWENDRALFLVCVVLFVVCIIIFIINKKICDARGKKLKREKEIRRQQRLERKK